MNIKGHIINYLLSEDEHKSSSVELEGWIADDDTHKESLNQYTRIWEQGRILSRRNHFNYQQAWLKVHKEIGRKNVFKKRMQSFGYTAMGMVASLLLFLGLNIFTNIFSSNEIALVVSTNYGNRSQTTLPDGTVVELNAGSSLSYHFNSRKKIREVQFRGEGYFEVAKCQIPFVVNTKEGLDIKVLGTKFNLTTYAEGNCIVTTLVEGSVEVKSPNNKIMILKPGQTASYDKTGRKLISVDANVSNMLGWRNNKLYMDNMSLQEVAKKLERWYDVIIEFENPEMGAKFHYTGVLQEETVYDVMNALSRLSNIKYKSTGKKFMLSEKLQMPMK